MEIHIDRKVCQGHGRCVVNCPELIFFDEEGFGHTKQNNVPVNLEQKAERAKLGCPERAISITND